MSLNGHHTTYPKRLTEDDLPALADALGVPDHGTATLRAECVNPEHPGDRDHNMSVFTHDDGTLGVVCHSHQCTPTVLLAQLAKLIEDEPRDRGDGGQRRRREPLPLPTDDELAEWSQDLRTLGEQIYGTRVTELLRAAGWEGAHERLADLGVGFSGSSLTMPVRDADAALIGLVSYTPGAPRERRHRAKGKRGLFPAPEAIEGDRVVYLHEGESSAVTGALAGLPSVGFPGANWKPAEDAKRFTRFKRVVVVPDCDQPGRSAAESIRASLAEHGANVSVIDLDESQQRGHDFRDLAKQVGMESAADQVRELAGVDVDGAEALDQITDALKRYVRFASDDQAHAVALWLAASHAFALDCFDTAPYLAVTSAERRSGKTRLIEVIAELAHGAWRISTAPTISSLFRVIDAHKPTVLVDEADELFASNGDELKQIRAALNAGYRRGATVPRTEGDGANRQVVNYSVFCMKLLAGLRASHWPDTTRDRCIVIELKRRHGAERVERFRHRHAAPVLHALRSRMASWAEEHEDELRDHEPVDMPEIHDRAFEVWEPLLSVAAIAGGQWPERATTAALALSGVTEDTEDTIGVRLLADMRRVFTMQAKEGRLTSADALTALNALPEAPWSAYRDGQGINAYRLGRHLRAYGIATKSMRFGERWAKGWERSDFADAWSRYLPPEKPDPEKSGTSGTPGTTPNPAPGKPSTHGDVPDVPDVSESEGVTARDGSEYPYLTALLNRTRSPWRSQ